MNNEFAISDSKSTQFVVVAKSQYCVVAELKYSLHLRFD